MGRIIAFAALVTMLLIGAQVVAQALPASASHDPPWLLLELGKRAFREKDFGQALDYFRSSIAKGGVTPEAEMWIGRVFEEEGELDLAENQYRRALSDSSQFQIPGQATAILYDLARIYYNTNQYGKYQVVLKRIVGKDTRFSDTKEAFTRQAMVRVLKTNGMNKLLVLYRLHDKQSLQAHSDLGTLDYRTGRYSDAILNLTFSTVTILTVTIDAFKTKDPGYGFSTVDNLLSMATKNTRVNAYVSSTNFFRDLYYLAAALYAGGSEERSESIWKAVVKWSPKDVWYRRSVAQIRKPYIEPIISIRE